MFNGLLEILGRGMAVDTAELLTGWLNEYGYTLADSDEGAYKTWLEGVVDDLFCKRFAAADQRVRAWLAKEPNSVAGHLALAAVSLHQDAVVQAQDSLEKICQCRPDHTLALYALGHCSERQGDESRAAACYQDCLKFRSFLSLPLQRLAAINVKNLQYESALEHYLSLRQIDPEIGRAHV
jgi:tetratricopeptide (TPR) repeat protein